jgi:multidrug transporter EmrE-like cation transporter
MVSLIDLPAYVAYALAGTGAAAFAKAAIAEAQGGRWLGFLVRGSAGGACILASFGLLVFLLGRSDLSVMVPIAVGINLVAAAVIAVVAFGERVSAAKAAGFGLIGLGVVCLSLSQ